ncbi:MAG: class I SAM-dependent methyltransferase [Bdellovibrionota bacterium]
MDPQYWNGIYRNKTEREVSWFQELPAKSLELIDEFGLSKDAPIVDIGGGDSHLVDALLERGFTDITVLDISSVSLERAKARLGERAKSVSFVEADVTKFAPPRVYQLWHDRAAFHFLTTKDEVDAYLRIAAEALAPGGFLIVSTFSKSGPDKCSGLQISQYSESDLKSLFGKYFTDIRCFEDVHTTPWGASQSFVYCGFVRR